MSQSHTRVKEFIRSHVQLAAGADYGIVPCMAFMLCNPTYDRQLCPLGLKYYQPFLDWTVSVLNRFISEAYKD